MLLRVYTAVVFGGSLLGLSVVLAGGRREYRALGCKLGCRHHYTLMLGEHAGKWVHRRYGKNTQKAGGS